MSHEILILWGVALLGQFHLQLHVLFVRKQYKILLLRQKNFAGVK